MYYTTNWFHHLVMRVFITTDQVIVVNRENDHDTVDDGPTSVNTTSLKCAIYFGI